MESEGRASGRSLVGAWAGTWMYPTWWLRPGGASPDPHRQAPTGVIPTWFLISP